MRLLAVSPAVLALENGLGFRPGLGWNSDYCTNCTGPPGSNGFGGEVFVSHIATYIAKVPQPAAAGLTLKELGFHYVNMDASWDLSDRDERGLLVPDPALWPSGLKATVDFVHGLGLGFGLYGDRGSQDCAGNPGNLDHEESDAKQYADWQIDWYKTDSCHAASDRATAFTEYMRMRDIMNKTGRVIWLALCGWKPWYAPPDPANNYPGGQQVANSWRVGPDTGTGWTAVIINIASALSVADFAGPTSNGGGWNDGSLQLTPGMGQCPPSTTRVPDPSNNCMTLDRFRTQYAAWCMLAMNLMLVGNLSALDSSVVNTWANPELVSINQDPLGKPARSLNGSVTSRRDYVRATMAECGGEPEMQQWAFGDYNQLRNEHTNLCLNVEGCKQNLIYDGCTTPGTKTCGDNEAFVVDGDHFVSALPGNLCISENRDHTLSVAACDPTRPDSQHFALVNGSLKDKTGMCLTAANAPPPSSSAIIMGRPLAGDSTAAAKVGSATEPGFAVMFINNDDVEMDLVCDRRCLVSLGLDSARTYVVRDVLHRATWGAVSPTNFSLDVRLPPGGVSAVFRLTEAPALI
mmetsp:Transcript_92221/g.246568  ORF Transcript_92221/g.246568 Transcript_92221/m.246568 type:complete len:577 (-) Transcript_92221:139-1869(-)